MAEVGDDYLGQLDKVFHEPDCSKMITLAQISDDVKAKKRKKENPR